MLVPQALEEAAFRGRQVQGVAVDIDPLSVAPLVDFGAIRIEHGHHQEGGLQEDGLDGGVLVMAEEVVGEVQEGRRGGGLVAVHLGP